MTEITRVPLQPIAKGALGKLWLGVLAAVLAAAALAWSTMAPGVKVETLSAGTGPSPTLEQVAMINYVGRLTDGKEFDRGEQVPMPLKGVIKGFADGLAKMKEGGKYRLTIPSELAYGSRESRNPQTGEVAIPANSDLVFEVELLKIMTMEEFQQIMQLRQMMQMQAQQQAQQGGAAPEGAAPPPQ
jgi:FKBP-type peptidyl-prolyl cis-trans isomerase FkpA